MLTLLDKIFSIDPLVEQTKSLIPFKRLEINYPTGDFFSDPWQVKEEFLNTPIGDVVSSLENVGQARLLLLSSGESYTAHSDPDDRYHVAIITNPYSFLVNIEDNKMYHLPADGKLWHMDTGKIHVAANWGPRDRIHLNARVLLPKLDLNKEIISIKVVDGDYDWKQLSYMPLMKFINQSVKNGIVTGFKSTNEKEVHLNVTDKNSIKQIIENIKSKGVDVITNVL
jgi:hypothetical protein